MKSEILEKLDWQSLCKNIASFTNTAEASDHCTNLKPTLGKEDIFEQWNKIEAITHINRTGISVPVEHMDSYQELFRLIGLGQILDYEQIKDVRHLLELSSKISYFLKDQLSKPYLNSEFRKSSEIKLYTTRIYEFDGLLKEINNTFDTEGYLLDTASPTLKKLRDQVKGIRGKIENELKKLMLDQKLETYLQDNFYTVRADRYVVPIRLDGRGRIPGTIYDTSESEQSLYIEPSQIAALNEQHLELKVSEKIESLRIQRQFSAKVASELDTLRDNYKAIIEIDIIQAFSKFGIESDSIKVEITNKPTLNLLGARHPLLTKELTNHDPVANDLCLKPQQNMLVISGPNAGGKTVALKTIGLLHMMVKAGLYIPVENESQIFLFDHIFLELGDSQSLSANLSTFSGHIRGLVPILETATSKDLVLIDELAIGTEPKTGAAIAQSIVENLLSKNCIAAVTTHYDELKGMALKENHIRNASMEFSLTKLRPTFRLITDVPGLSYGLEVSEQMGLSKEIVERARSIRGKDATGIDDAVSLLMNAREDTLQETKAVRAEKLSAQAEKTKWQQERDQLKKSRENYAERISSRYEEKFTSLRRDFDQIVSEIKRIIKAINKSDSPEKYVENLRELKKSGEDTLSNMSNSLKDMNAPFFEKKDLPGKKAVFSDLKIGMNVYVISLNKNAIVRKIPAKESMPIEIEIGILTSRVLLNEIRILPQNNSKPKKKARPSKPKKDKKEYENIGLVLKSSTNSIDLRGKDTLDAVTETWNFLDRALMRGEKSVIIIHGNGADSLKKELRRELQTNCPYDVVFRPGSPEEGGDGVTIIGFEK